MATAPFVTVSQFYSLHINQSILFIANQSTFIASFLSVLKQLIPSPMFSDGEKHECSGHQPARERAERESQTGVRSKETEGQGRS